MDESRALSSHVDLREKLSDFLVVFGVEHLNDHVPLGSIPQPLFRQEKQRAQPVLPVHDAEDVRLVLAAKLNKRKRSRGREAKTRAILRRSAVPATTGVRNTAVAPPQGGWCLRTFCCFFITSSQMTALGENLAG